MNTTRTRMAPEDRRELILQVATAALERQGFSGLSMRSLARQCGMTAPGVMRYFPTMDDVLVAVLRRIDEQDVAQMAHDMGPEPSFEERMRAAARFYATRGSQVIRLALVEGEAVNPGHPAHGYYLQRRERWKALLKDLFSDRYSNAEQLAELAFYTLEGVREEWMWGATSLDYEATFDRLWSLVSSLGIPSDPATSRVT